MVRSLEELNRDYERLRAVHEIEKIMGRYSFLHTAMHHIDYRKLWSKRDDCVLDLLRRRDLAGRGGEAPELGSYNVVVEYPTGVQYSVETAEQYCEMSDEISEILKTIDFKAECTFSEEPIPVEIETTAMEVSERYLGRWEDLHIGEGMKFDDYVWNVEFRSDGTGTFEFVYGANDTEYLNFTFSTILPRDNGHMEGVSIYNDYGDELKFYITCAWNNELQTGVMTLHDWEKPDQYWMFKLVSQ